MKAPAVCFACNKNFMITRETTACPKCGSPITSENAKQIVDEYEFKRLQKRVDRMDAVGDIGQGCSDIGCAMFLLPFGFFGMLIILSMCSAF